MTDRLCYRAGEAPLRVVKRLRSASPEPIESRAIGGTVRTKWIVRYGARPIGGPVQFVFGGDVGSFLASVRTCFKLEEGVAYELCTDSTVDPQADVVVVNFNHRVDSDYSVLYRGGVENNQDLFYAGLSKHLELLVEDPNVGVDRAGGAMLKHELVVVGHEHTAAKSELRAQLVTIVDRELERGKKLELPRRPGFLRTLHLPCNELVALRVELLQEKIVSLDLKLAELTAAVAEHHRQDLKAAAHLRTRPHT